MKHINWLKRWWKHVTATAIILGGIGTGLAYGGNVLSNTDNLAEKYINAKVDAHMAELVSEMKQTKMEIQYLKDSQDKTNKLLDRLIISLVKK